MTSVVSKTLAHQLSSVKLVHIQSLIEFKDDGTSTVNEMFCVLKLLH